MLSNTTGEKPVASKIRMLIESRIEKSDSHASSGKPRIDLEPIGSRNHREPIQTVRMVVYFDIGNFVSNFLHHKSCESPVHLKANSTFK